MKKPALLHLFVLYFFLNASAQWDLPANMYPDSLYAPFDYGIASFDPSSESIILWTKVETEYVTDSLLLEISTDASFSQTQSSEILTTNAVSDKTVVFKWMENLQAGQQYYYRFIYIAEGDFQNNISQTGKFKTLPSETENVNLAVASCSSVFSGYFNAYKRISERDELDAVIHLGDYIYDFVDSDEQVRIPDPLPTDPVTLQEFRDLHKYHLLDPDLRAMRQNHAMIHIWDNHDLSLTAGTNPDAMQAFFEYAPVDVPDTNRIYRQFAFGDLLDLNMIDILTYRGLDTLSNDTSYSIMGLEQEAWLNDQLLTSNAQWKLIANQNMVGTWSSVGVPDGLGLDTDGDVFDDSSWDGFTEARFNLLSFIADENINDVLFLSGDAHISLANNLPLNPFDSLTFNSVTGEGSVAVEFLPSSISRGNMDEQGISPNLGPGVAAFSMALNPHQVYMEVVQHGYGLLNIKPDSIVAEFWYSPILQLADTEELGYYLSLKPGENRWTVYPDSILNPVGIQIAVEQYELNMYPNPFEDFILIDGFVDRADVQVFNSEGKEIIRQTINSNRIDLSDLEKGLYFVYLEMNGQQFLKKIIKW